MEFAPVIIAFSNILTLALAASFAAGWHGGRHSHARPAPNAPVTEQETSTGRIALADLRVRMRRLEAIAAAIEP